MVDFTKITKQVVATVNKGTIEGGLDKNVEPLEIEAIHTKINTSPLIIKIEPANLTVNNSVRISMSEGGQFYGRAEGLASYQSTRRTIAIGFSMIRSEVLNGNAALSNNALTANLLQQVLYPAYMKTGTQNTSVIKTPPFFKIKYGDLIGDFKGGMRTGLTGYFTSVDVNISGGGFGGVGIGDNLGIGVGGVKIPIEYTVRMNFSVLHDHLVGWYDGKFADDGRLNWPLNTGIVANNTAGAPGHSGGNVSGDSAKVPGSPDNAVGGCVQSGKGKVKFSQ